MRVLLTSKKRGWSGETAFLGQLAEGLVGRGHEVVLGSRPEAQLRQRLDPAQVERLDLELLHEPTAALALAKDLRALRKTLREVDLVHTHASWDTWVVAMARSSARSNVPQVRTRHNLKPIRTHPPNRWLYGKAMSTVVACSKTVAEDLAKARLVPPARVRTICNGIDPSHFDPAQRDRDAERQRFRVQLGAPHDARVVLYLSRISQTKEPEVLVGAAERMLDAGVDAWFALVGSAPGGGEWFDALAARVEARNPRIQLLPFCEDPAGAFLAADVMVLPSQKEAFGLTTVEAMAMRCPPVCADRGGSAEIVTDGETGLLFEAGDEASCAAHITELLNDGERRVRMGDSGRADVLRRFTVERMVEQYEQLYRELGRERGS